MSWDVGAWVINTLKKLIETHGAQEFTSNGTFVVPAGTYRIWVTACGGGGGGAGADTDATCYGGGGGGGAACIIRRPFSVTPGESISITIGSGGAKGASASTAKAGGKGGSTVIGNLITLAGGDGGLIGFDKDHLCALPGGDGGGYGGHGGHWNNSNKYGWPPEPGSNGALGSGGCVQDKYYIEDGSYPNLTAATKGAGGGGGGSYGNGGAGGSSNRAASAPGYGGGGGGAAYATNKTATAGGKGYCLIEW